MCDMAPQIIYLFDRMGVPFSRTKEGLDGFSPFWRNAASPDGVCRRFDRTAASLRARRTGSQVGSRRKGQQIRRLGNALARAGRSSGLPRPVAMNLQTLELKSFHGRRRDHGDGRAGTDFRQIDKFDDLHRQRDFGLLSAGRAICERRIYPGSSDFDSGRRQTSLDVRIRSRRRRPRLGAEKARAIRATRKTFPNRNAGIFSKKNIRLTAISFRATSRRARSFRFVSKATASAAKIRFISI